MAPIPPGKLVSSSSSFLDLMPNNTAATGARLARHDEARLLFETLCRSLLFMVGIGSTGSEIVPEFVQNGAKVGIFKIFQRKHHRASRIVNCSTEQCCTLDSGQQRSDVAADFVVGTALQTTKVGQRRTVVALESQSRTDSIEQLGARKLLGHDGCVVCAIACNI